MDRFLTKTGKQQQHLNLSMVLFLVSYSLSLCTLSPLIHADTVRRGGQTQHSSTEHCARPITVPQTATSPTTNRNRMPEPLCCELRSEANKTIPVSSVQIDIPPLFLLTLLPLADELSRKVQLLPILQAPHSSRPPPVYLLHATFLI